MSNLPRRTLLAATAGLATAGVLNFGQPQAGTASVLPKTPAKRPVPPACWNRTKWFGLFEAQGARAWPAAPKPSAGLLFVKLNSTFTVARLQSFSKRGLTPVVSLEPWLTEHLQKDLTNPRYNLASIIRGDHDRDLRRIASVIRSYGGPVLIRWAHEANGDWYPWCIGVGTNTPRQYRQAWQRVRPMFPANTRWVWSVNHVRRGERYDVPGLYPGDGACDYVGWTGYGDRGVDDPNESWAETYRIVSAITRKKSFVITETGAPDGPAKVGWIDALGPYLKAHPRIKGLIWFDHNTKNAATDNYGLNSTASWTAFQKAMRTGGF